MHGSVFTMASDVMRMTTAYGMLVKMTMRVPVNAVDDAKRALIDMTQGKAGFF